MMLVYGHGDIDLDAELLTDFYLKASDTVCAEAIAFVGRSLKEQQQKESLDAVLPRFVELWEQRFSLPSKQGRLNNSTPNSPHSVGGLLVGNLRGFGQCPNCWMCYA